MPLLQPVERCPPDAGLGLKQPMPCNTWIADNPRDFGHSLDWPAVDELGQGKDMLSLSLEQSDDCAALVPVVQCRPARAKGLLDLAWPSDWSRPIFEAKWCRKGGKPPPTLFDVYHLAAAIALANLDGQLDVELNPPLIDRLL